MADITDVQAVRFSNEKVRPLADAFERFYWAAKRHGIDWDAEDMDTKMVGDTVVDGSAVDGRNPITAAMITGLKGVADAIVTDLEANSNFKLNKLAQISVNGGA